MATTSEIFEVRLAVNDPANVINIIEVAAAANLPSSPEPQTAYYTTDTGRYYATEKTSWAVVADYDYAELRISDTRIATIIDNIGTDKAKCRILSLIAGTLFNDLRLVRTTSGTESAEYNRLADAYQYYKNLAADCKDNYNSDNDIGTGTVRTTKTPEIGGGNL